MPVGKTKTVGYQFGIRRTYPIPQKEAWEFMFSDEGLSIWLGTLEENLQIHKPFKTKHGIEGLVRVFKLHSHIRINWKKPSWSNMSTVQLRIMPYKDTKTTIAIHQEKLSSELQRQEMKAYWNEIIAQLDEHLSVK